MLEQFAIRRDLAAGDPIGPAVSGDGERGPDYCRFALGRKELFRRPGSYLTTTQPRLPFAPATGFLAMQYWQGIRMLKGLSQFRDGHSVRLGYVHSASNACSSGAAPSPVDVPIYPPKSGRGIR